MAKQIRRQIIHLLSVTSTVLPLGNKFHLIITSYCSRKFSSTGQNLRRKLKKKQSKMKEILYLKVIND